VHTLASTGAAFAILFATVGFSFFYVSSNPVTIAGDPWIGFRGTPLTPAIAEAIGTSEQTGFLVVLVYSDSPADSAGMRGGDRVVEVGGEQLCAGGDIIIELDGRPVTGTQEIQSALAAKSVGDTMDFTVLRGSVTFDIPVVLEESPDQEPPLPQCRSG
jgi:S1-C subfamily serine protease